MIDLRKKYNHFNNVNDTKEIQQKQRSTMHLVDVAGMIKNGFAHRMNYLDTAYNKECNTTQHDDDDDDMHATDTQTDTAAINDL